MSDEQLLYEFNLDEMTVGEWVTLFTMSQPMTNSDTARVILMSKQFTNTSIDDIPLVDLGNYLKQFYAALETHMKEIPS